MYPRTALIELLWFISGDTNIQHLVKNNVNIWNEWPFVSYLRATKQSIPPTSSPEWTTQLTEFVNKIKTDDQFAAYYGNLGPVYGKQWRSWDSIFDCDVDPGVSSGTHTFVVHSRKIDQLALAINAIITDPYSRRIIVNSWNVSQLEDMALPPCHNMFQFVCTPMSLADRVQYANTYHSGAITSDMDNFTVTQALSRLNIPTTFVSCKLNMRSSDVFLGLPFNIFQYSVLLRMVAHVTNTAAKELVYSGADVHIYSNHISQCMLQATRAPYESPKLIITRDSTHIKTIDDFSIDDFSIEGYNYHPAIQAPVAV
jgi:thymidylate synthase